GFRVARVQQALPESQFTQLRQHVVDGVIHGAVRINQGGVPVEQDDVSMGAWQLQNTHDGQGPALFSSQGSLLPVAAKRIIVLICVAGRGQNSATHEFSGNPAQAMNQLATPPSNVLYLWPLRTLFIGQLGRLSPMSQ